MAGRNSSEYAVVWPRLAKAVEIKPLARRRDTMDGKTVAFLWDDLFRGDEIWPILKQELSARYTGLNFVDHDAFGSTHGDEEHLFVHNGMLGFPMTKTVKLPQGWRAKLRDAES